MPNSHDPNQIIRPEILALSAYHVPPSTGMVKLDAMENPYALPEIVRAQIAGLTAEASFNRYPDASAAELKLALRKALDIPEQMDVILGNGSDEIIQMIALAVARPGAVLMSVEPAFVMFRMISTFANLQYVGVPLKDDFALDLDAMLAAIKTHQPAVIFLAYPNNPTGNLFDADAIKQIIQAAPGIVIVDEAYHAFANASMLDQLAHFPNLLLMRTLSKLGLAGLRLGLLVGRSYWLSEFDKIRLPYNVGVATQIIANAVLQHTDVLLGQAETIRAERAELLDLLKQMDTVTVYPSDANFILFRLPNASDVFQKLKARGILIKNLDGSHPLLTNCLRVTVGTPEENKQFFVTLQTILREKV